MAIVISNGYAQTVGRNGVSVVNSDQSRLSVGRIVKKFVSLLYGKV